MYTLFNAIAKLSPSPTEALAEGGDGPYFLLIQPPRPPSLPSPDRESISITLNSCTLTISHRIYLKIFGMTLLGVSNYV